MIYSVVISSLSTCHFVAEYHFVVLRIADVIVHTNSETDLFP